MKRTTLFPSISDLLASPTIKPWVDRLQPATVSAIAHGVIQEAYDEMKSVATEFRMPDFSELTARIIARLSDREEHFSQPPINASGIFFHPRYGSPAPPLQAVEQMFTALGSVPSPEISESLLRELTGAEDALVLNAYASAHLAYTVALAKSRISGACDGSRLVVSRRDVSEGLHGFRLLEFLESSRACRRIDIGTVDGTTAEDYFEAFEEVPSPDFVYFARPVRNGFQSTLDPVGQEEVLLQARAKEIVSVLDLETTSLVDLSPLIPALPTVSAAVTEGFDLVVFPGNGLVGGPDAGILVGKKHLIEKIRNHVFYRAFRPENSAIAALQATLSLYLDKATRASETIPILELLHTSEDNIANRAKRIATQLGNLETVQHVFLERLAAVLHPGDPVSFLPAPAIVIAPTHLSAEDMHAELIAQTPPLVSRLVPCEHFSETLRAEWARLQPASSDPPSTMALALFLQAVPARRDMQILDAFAKPTRSV